MFWWRKSGHDGRAPRSQAAKPSGHDDRDDRRAESSADAALDTVVAMLRTLGRDAFDIFDVDAATFDRRCQAWAEHLAIGAPHPDEGSEPSAPRRASASERDWVGARQFVARRRQDECSFVSQNLGDLRVLISDLTERLATTLVDDRATDKQVTDQIARLRTVATGDSLDMLRRDVIRISETLAVVMEERSHRLQRQLVALDLRVAALSEELQEVKQESSLDGLTRVYNRAAFDRTFERIHKLSSLSAQPSSLIFADLDHLKTINDRYGHRSGDEALRCIANCLVRTFPRRSDVIARYGGDEFVALLPQTPVQQSARLARRFLDCVRAVEVEHGAQIFSITASVGLAELRPSESAEAWLDRADKALYEAKANGRNAVVVAP
ncbi:MAG: GGDEF domain-containing protein [Chloroflexi bacterium]|nr:GGDEF domain-containing protein [Chloroflexota bacterium]